MIYKDIVKHWLSFLALIAFAISLVIGIANLIKQVTKQSPLPLTGTTWMQNEDFWDLWYEPETNEVHVLRIRPEGVSVRINNSKSWAAQRQLDLPNISRNGRLINFISGIICNPADIDGDGDKEYIINLNDSTASWLFTYNTRGDFSELYHEEWNSPADDQIWDSNLFVWLAADFGSGTRLVISRVTRFDSTPRAVIVLNPANKQTDYKLEMGAVPMGRFNLLDNKLGTPEGFLCETTITNNGQDYNGLADSCRYLLKFTQIGSGWTYRILCKTLTKLSFFPINTADGRGIVCVSPEGLATMDLEGNIVSDMIRIPGENVRIRGVFDYNQDGLSDQLLLINQNKSYLMQVESLERITNLTDCSIEAKLSDTKINYLPPNCNSKYIICSADNYKITLLDDHLKIIGRIPYTKPVLNLDKRTNSYHGNVSRFFVNFTGIMEGNAVFARNNQIHFVDFYPQIFTAKIKPYFSLALFLLSNILLIFTFIILKYQYFKSERRYTEISDIYKTASIVFRRRPSDVNLYIEHHLSDRWNDICEKVKITAAEAVEHLHLEIPHDNLREEIGIPKSGEIRLINLLASRRVALNFIRQGHFGFSLIEMLNFTIDPKYRYLISDARTILNYIRKDENYQSNQVLTEKDLKEAVKQLEQANMITGIGDPRKIFYKVDSRSEDKICGSLKLSRSGKEVKLKFDDDDVELIYHSKFSPSFTEFMALIGIDPEKDFSRQIFFADEVNL